MDCFINSKFCAISASLYSEEVATQIDRQVREIAVRCHEQARKLLRENRPLMDKLVELLLDQETIEGDQFRKMVTDYQNSQPSSPVDLVKAGSA
ncbi:hypothetical protein [Roseofilum capinflatum]|uniref:hypothetical protein n=1 Tax=Roseofilum capinflatum TaxID=3082943 RepID=UPI0024BD8403|nr:hypothetical protein [Roseofilum capinflatum]